MDRFNALHMTFAQDGRALSCADMFAAWGGDTASTDLFCSVLADVPFDAFFWETPPVTAAATDRTFEMVLIDSPALARTRPDPSAFAAELEASAGRDRLTATFPSLGGDALLIAPTPADPPADFAHLAAFLRSAADERKGALWQAVSEAIALRLGKAPLWISTSGLGVPWLHVRLDSRPKYYQYGPFRESP